MDFIVLFQFFKGKRERCSILSIIYFCTLWIDLSDKSFSFSLRTQHLEEKHQIVLSKHFPTLLTFRKATTEQVFRAEKIIAHESYNPKSFDNDIAIVKLDRPAMLNRHVKLACLPKQGYQLPASMKFHNSFPI